MSDETTEQQNAAKPKAKSSPPKTPKSQPLVIGLGNQRLHQKEADGQLRRLSELQVANTDRIQALRQIYEVSITEGDELDTVLREITIKELITAIRHKDALTLFLEQQGEI